MKQLILLILIIFLFGCSNSEQSDNTNNQEEMPVGEFLDDWTYRVSPTSISNFDIAEFRLWVPENTSNLKAILVLSNFYNSNGLGLAQSAEWQEYAATNNLAIIGVHLKSLNNTAPYGNAFEGSGHALLTALEKIAEYNSINEIVDLPFILRGYSAGGIFSYTFSAFKPQRTIAFANIRGGSLSMTSDANKLIPGMMLIGDLDTPSRNLVIKNTVLANREENGLWNYAVELNQDHYGPLENSDELIKLFFTKALNQRISEQSNELLPVSENTGWLGDNISKNVFYFNNYPGNKSLASWLIDEDFANAWKNYQME